MAKKPASSAVAEAPPAKGGKKTESSTTRIFGAKVMEHGYTALPNILLRAQNKLEITTTQFNILAQLLSYWIDPKRPPFPSKKELAGRMGITSDTLRINVAKLENMGLIQREQRKTASGDYGSNTYLLDGLVRKLNKLEVKFDEERKEKERLRSTVEARRPRKTIKPPTGGTNGKA
ncbi:helix-turn-helix domain-containing protein [Falsirhodobacter sp. 1013]|uniref:helix-turn-helix domain-containing protein n=1 Tax=Falsirhodobacter sp. 1013 TaxID=3417566 RepID=UPI003EC0C40A